MFKKHPVCYAVLSHACLCVCCVYPLEQLTLFIRRLKWDVKKNLIQFRTSTLMQKEKLLKRTKERDRQYVQGRKKSIRRRKIVSAEIKEKPFVDCEILTHRCNHQLQSFARTYIFIPWNMDIVHTLAQLKLPLIWPITFIRICRFAHSLTHSTTCLRKY